MVDKKVHRELGGLAGEPRNFRIELVTESVCKVVKDTP